MVRKRYIKDKGGEGMDVTILGYSIMGMIASRFGFTYQQTRKITLRIKEVVCTN